MQQGKNAVPNNSQLLIGLLVGVGGFGLLAGVFFVLLEPVFFGEREETSLLLSEQERETHKIALDIGTTDSELLSSTDLEQLMSGKSSYVRTTTLHRALAQASVEQLTDFFNQSITVKDASLRGEIQDTAVRQLAVIDPKQAISLIRATSPERRRVLLTIIFEEWSIADIDQAVEYGLQLDEDDQLAVCDGVFNARFDLSEVELHKIATQLGLKHRMLELFAGRQLKEPVENASAKWHRLLMDYDDAGDALSPVQIELLVHVATSWVNHAGVEAVQSIKDSGDHTIKTLVLERVFDVMSVEDPRRAFALVDGLRHVDRGLMTQVIKDWANVDGLAAFNAGASVTDVFLREPVQDAALETWGDADPHSLLAALEKIPDKFQSSAFSCAMRGLARIDPDAALTQLNGISEGPTRARIAEMVVAAWSEQDPRAALQWVQYDPLTEEQELKSKLQTIVLKELTQTDSRLAMDLALSLPLAENGIGPEHTVVSERAKVNVDEAMAMLPRVRNQSTREATYASLGRAFIRAGRSNQAIELAKNSSEGVRRGYLRSLTDYWVDREPLDLFNHLDDIPIESVKRHAAVVIAINHKRRVALTKEQIESLKQYVDEIYWPNL